MNEDKKAADAQQEAEVKEPAKAEAEKTEEKAPKKEEKKSRKLYRGSWMNQQMVLSVLFFDRKCHILSVAIS